MARLEIEIAGVNDDLKRVLKESKIELSNFSKGLNFDTKGARKVNDTLTSTKKLLADISAGAKNATTALSGLNRTGLKASIDQQRAATEAARTATAEYKAETARLTSELQKLNVATNQAKNQAQNYRTESAKSRAEQDALRLANTRNRQSVVAASGSYKEAQQRLTALGQAIRNAEGGFRSTDPAIKSQIQEYRRLNDELKRFDAQLGNHQRDVGNYGKALAGLKGLAASYFGFTAIIAGAQQVLKSNAEISDSLANVRRTAGLTATEAENLSKSLKTIDTRTSLKGLIDIAAIGGQLGITKTQLAGFTAAIDQLAVTLGDELQGGPEGIAKSLGVLDNVFGITVQNAGDVNKAYNQIGSAILGLGQSGLATGAFLSDFGERVGGIAKQAGLSLPVILSYGAVLQENGVSAEVAGSSFKRLISQLSTNSAGFFNVAKLADTNLTLKDFNTLVNTDTKSALDLFFNGLRKGGTSTIAFNTILKSLKLSQAGVSQSIAALSNNQIALNGHIEQATKDFDAGTLSAEQFLIKNNTLGGSVDKLGKAFENVTNSGAIASFFKAIIDGATASISALDKLLTAVSGLLTDPKGFIGNSARTSRNAGRDATIANANRAGIAQIKNQGNKNGAFDELNKEKKILKEVDARYKDLKTSYEAIDPRNRSLAQTKQFQEAEENLRFQIALVRSMGKEYSALYEAQKRSNAEVPKGVIKDKKAKRDAVPTDFKSLILSEVSKAENYDALTGLEGIDKTNEKTKQKYDALNDALDKIQKRYNAKYKAGSTERNEFDKLTANARLINETNKNKELEQNQLTFAKKQADIIAGIESDAGITRIASQEQELQQNDAHYADLARQYSNNADILKTITEAKEQERLNIIDKYRQKQLEDEGKIQDKINDLVEKGFRPSDGSRKSQDRLDADLKERIRKIQKYYDELKALNAGNPYAVLGLTAAQAAQVGQLKGNAQDAKDSGFSRELSGVASKFGEDLISTFTKANAFADKSFSDVISGLATNLTDTLQNVFIKKFGDQLSKILEKSFDNMSDQEQALTGGALILGSVISGITKKTSALGQGVGGALKGAGTGAVIGSAIPGVGTVAGAIVGGLAGAIGGIFGSSKAKKQEAAQKAQLEEEKKQTALLERQNALAYSASIIGRQTVNGVVTGVEVNEFGELTTKISGQDLSIVLQRANASRSRGV